MKLYLEEYTTEGLRAEVARLNDAIEKETDVRKKILPVFRRLRMNFEIVRRIVSAAKHENGLHP